MVFILAFLIGLNLQAFAQFTEEEATEKEKWEDFLQNAGVIDQEQPFSDREAVTRPWRLTLEKDGVYETSIRLTRYDSIHKDDKYNVLSYIWNSFTDSVGEYPWKIKRVIEVGEYNIKAKLIGQIK